PVTQLQTQQPQNTDENFDTVRVGVVGNGSRLLSGQGTPVSSNIRVDYVAATPPVVQQTLNPQNRWLHVTLAGGESITFSVQCTNLGGLLERTAMRQFLFTIIGGTFDPNTLSVDLMYAGAVTQTFTGISLANLGLTGEYVFPGGDRAILASIAAPSDAF